jgi:biotin transport system substrate-specific component
LWGFLLCALVFWLLTGILGDKSRLIAAILGMLCCYGCGMVWMAFSQTGNITAQTLSAAFLQGVAPYLLPDGIKITLAFFLSNKLKRFV